ncbi:MAG: GNAT family N-acetyltransferase [Eubacteriaceae bacterium]|nr:GNAT family N-acetyltransferase [Eubacteriaceae bacterium]
MRKYFLHTHRLSFGTWNHDDIPLARSLWGDKDVTKYISATGTFSEENILSRLSTEIKNYETYNIQYFPIFETATGDFIGCCGLRPYVDDDTTLEIGFHLKKEFWGKGFATEAATAMIKYAFETLNKEKLFAGHNPKNEASRKTLKKLGFIYTHDEFYAPTGLMHPSYIKTKM